MDISGVRMLFGYSQVFIGAAMARRALASRARLAPWRGQLIVAASAIVLGIGLIAARGEVQIATAIVAAGCIIGFVCGSIVSIRERRRP